MNSSVTLGALRTRAHGKLREHEIAYVKGYGVTCSSLVTSNGNLFLVAKVLKSALLLSGSHRDIKDWHAELIVDGVSVPSEHVEAALVSARAAAMEQLQESWVWNQDVVRESH